MPFLVDDGAVPDAASGASRRRTGRASTTPPSASCAPPARRSCPSFWAQPVVRRAGGDRQRPSVHLRHPRRRAPRSGSRSWPTRTASGAAGRSSTAPTPARAGSTSPRRSSRCRRRSWSDAPERAVELPVDRAPRHPHRRCGPRQPRAGVARRGADRRLARRRPGSDRGPPDATISEALGVQTNNVAEWTGVRPGARARPRLGAHAGRPAPRLEAHRRAAPRSLAGQGREAAAALGRGDGDAGGVPALVGDPRAARAELDRDRLANEAIDRVAAGGPARRGPGEADDRGCGSGPSPRHGGLQSAGQRGGRTVARPPGNRRA